MGIVNGKHAFNLVADGASLVACIMNVRRVFIQQYPPSYTEASALEKISFCASLSENAKDPILVLITLATAVGSFCILSGFILLCMVSKAINDQTSEAILLMGMGFLVFSVAYGTWKLTNRNRIKRVLDAIKEESV